MVPLSPPSDVACLVSRPVIRKWFMTLPLHLQEDIKSPERLSPQDLQVPVEVESPLVLFDSRIHCDAVVARSRFSTWDQVLQQAANSRMRVVWVCWSLTSLCHSNGHIETMPDKLIPLLALPGFDPSFSGHNDRRPGCGWRPPSTPVIFRITG